MESGATELIVLFLECRRSAQKPDEELIIRFRKLYRHVLYRDVVTGRNSDNVPRYNPLEKEKCYVTPAGYAERNEGTRG